MFEVGLIMVGVAVILTVVVILGGGAVAIFKDEDTGGAIGLIGGFLCWGLYVIGIGVTIIGAVIKFL